MAPQTVIEVLQQYAEGEISTFIKVWTLVFASLTYSFFVSKSLPKGLSRLLALIPVLILNLILPLSLHTMHLGGSTAFFLVWLANFKLLSLALGVGPLSDPSLSLPKFAAFACLPIKTPDYHNSSKHGLNSFSNYLTKALLICFLLKMYNYTDLIHPKLTWALYAVHIYCGLELILALVGSLAKALIGVELEPQFNEPYLSASLQEFWGWRWNIMVSQILRPTVYSPVLNIATPVTGRKWASGPAVIATFVVSGLMHELIFYYLGRGRPTGEITGFFVLHGVCLTVEVAVKRVAKERKWGPGPPRWVSGPMTIAFVLATAFWLFFPEFMRTGAVGKAFEEYAAVEAFVKDVSYAFAFNSIHNTTLF